MSAIGIFDSGVGGLTVLQQITRQLPHESIIYYGDTARVPYGSKSPDTIIRYSIENAELLMEYGIKILVVACNTAAAYAMEELRNRLPIPVVGVIGPGADKATRVTQNGRIGVLGTKATILSQAYQTEIGKRLPGCEVYPVACPLFVPLVEEGMSRHPATELIIREYLNPLKLRGIDTLLLGCTHYPLLREAIQEEIGNHVRIVDSASTCAEEVSHILKENGLEETEEVSPQHHYMVSDDPEKFRALARDLLALSISIVSGPAYCRQT